MSDKCVAGGEVLDALKSNFSRKRMTARCPFCEAVYPVGAEPGHRIYCPCGAMGLLCAPNTEPETSVRLAEAGLSDTKADIIDGALSVVWAREWWRRGRSCVVNIKPVLGRGDAASAAAACDPAGNGLEWVTIRVTGSLPGHSLIRHG